MKCTAMAALVFAACLAWGPATGAAPAEKPEKALTGTAAAAAVDAGGKAGTVPSVQKDADKAIKAVAPQSDDKTGKADKSDKDGKENKDSKKEMAHVPTDDDCVLLDSLDTLTIPPLQASDFYIGSIHHGDSPAKVKRIFGPPAKFSPSRFGYIPYPANFPGLGRDLFQAISSGNWLKKFFFKRFPQAIG